MAGISGLGDFSRDLNKFVDSVGKLDGLSVSIESTDSVSTVVDKLQREIRRRGAMEPTPSELRGIAQDMLKEARKDLR